MKASNLISALGLSLTLLASSALAAEPQFRGQVSFRGADGAMQTGQRCGVADVSPTREVMKGMRESSRNKIWSTNANTIIPVAWHVITSGGGAGAVTQQQIDDSIEVLNNSFEPHGFYFTLASVDTTANDSWYVAGPDTAAEAAMKNALAIDPTNTFNIYSSSPGGGLLGWATFPWYYPEGSAQHGVVILNRSVPGGGAFPYDEGDTLVHEAGHYLGLFHTFQNGCRRPGDFLPDTPAERTPTSGCPIGKDTCPWGGVDPIHNFMDYSYDSCMDEFTNNQRAFMNWAVNRFKPGLLD